MLVMAVFTLYFPAGIWWLLVASTKQRGDLFSTNPLWFADFALFDNIGDLFAYRDGVYLKWILNSLLYAGLGAVVATILAAMCGYALAKYRFPGRETIFNVVLGGVLVPATALALPLFLLFSRVQLTDTFWAVFLPSVVSPFGVYLTRVFAEASVPDELLEASRLDGAGEVRTVLHRVDPPHVPRAHHGVPVPVRDHLEQLLPAAHHAAQRGAVPRHLRPLRLELDHQPVPRAAHLRARRRCSRSSR